MDLNQVIEQAAANGEWVLLAVGIVALLVPLILKALGKNVPLVDTLLNVAVSIASKVKIKKQPKPEDQAGVEGVANVVELKKPESKPGE